MRKGHHHGHHRHHSPHRRPHHQSSQHQLHQNGDQPPFRHREHHPHHGEHGRHKRHHNHRHHHYPHPHQKCQNYEKQQQITENQFLHLNNQSYQRQNFEKIIKNQQQLQCAKIQAFNVSHLKEELSSFDQKLVQAVNSLSLEDKKKQIMKPIKVQKKQIKQAKQDYNKDECKVCFDLNSQMIHTTCFHLCVCQSCSLTLKGICPVCRSQGSFKKVYRP